ncbi:hypothetical protein J4436_03540 [Candidatus Woesearchaeota archaeon]|nr:hypothetical protein [Candidatus Woesearchaeota archaeon]
MKVENITKSVLGLVLIFFGLWLIIRWWSSFLVIVKGFLPLFLGLIGLIFILLAFEK